MKHSNRSQYASRIAILGLTALAANAAHATDGYFDYGYGIKAKGVGGAGVAFPQDSLAPASNPAGIAILDNQTCFNVLAPAVVQHHVTAGVIWRFHKNLELSAFYAHTFEQSVNGSGNYFGPSANANLKMSQDSVGIAIGRIL